MAVDSGNDACVAAAEHISGSVDEFVKKMNLKAKELGMTRSYFRNPNGLPAKGQVTTSRDMARLSVAYLQRFPESINVHSMRSYTYNCITQHNRNRLLGTCAGVDGLKTGWIVASGYNLIATAKRGDTRLVAVVLGAPNPNARTTETTRLIEGGFQSLTTGTLYLAEAPETGVVKGAVKPTKSARKKIVIARAAKTSDAASSKSHKAATHKVTKTNLTKSSKATQSVTSKHKTAKPAKTSNSASARTVKKPTSHPPKTSIATSQEPKKLKKEDKVM
jgi:D-alanyl-D-alanine carboxypeptidase